LCLLGLLWGHLFYVASYGWRHGLYYDYGWYVPPVTLLFCCRHFSGWRKWRDPMPAAVGKLMMVLLLAVALVPLRVLQIVDPAWTLPQWTEAVMVVGITLLVLWKGAGTSTLVRMLPVLAFALTALRLPTAIEGPLVKAMTAGVIHSSSWMLNLAGMPVGTVGNQLGLGGMVVAVTEGCSGIKSSQSFLMASLFFGEWLQLDWRSRLILVAGGLFSAWLVNVARASLLAVVRFRQGEEGFQQAHDNAGLLAFVAGALLLWGLSCYLGAGSRGRQVLRRKTAAISGA